MGCKWLPPQLGIGTAGELLLARTDLMATKKEVRLPLPHLCMKSCMMFDPHLAEGLAVP